MMNLRQLTSAELAKARAAADYLCKLPVRLDAELAVKLDTLRADLTAEIEDRAGSAGDTGCVISLTPVR
jgi:hypothetical protein